MTATLMILAAILTGINLGIATMYGYQAWQRRKARKRAEEAAARLADAICVASSRMLLELARQEGDHATASKARYHLRTEHGIENP